MDSTDQVYFPIAAMQGLFDNISKLKFPISELGPVRAVLGDIDVGAGKTLDNHLLDLSLPIPNSSELLYQLSSLKRADMKAEVIEEPKVTVSPMGKKTIPRRPIPVAPKPVPKRISGRPTAVRAEPSSNLMDVIDDLSSDLSGPRPPAVKPLRPVPKKADGRMPAKPTVKKSMVGGRTASGPVSGSVKASLKDQFVRQMGLRLPTEQGSQPSPSTSSGVTPLARPIPSSSKDEAMPASEVLEVLEREIAQLNDLRYRLKQSGGMTADAPSGSSGKKPLDEETKRVLEELDKLLEHLPEEVVEDFTQSGAYFVYEKVMKYYGIS